VSIENNFSYELFGFNLDVGNQPYSSLFGMELRMGVQDFVGLLIFEKQVMKGSSGHVATSLEYAWIACAI